MSRDTLRISGIPRACLRKKKKNTYIFFESLHEMRWIADRINFYRQNKKKKNVEFGLSATVVVLIIEWLLNMRRFFFFQ